MPVHAPHRRLRRHPGEMAGHAVKRPARQDVVTNMVAGLMWAVHAHDRWLHRQLFEHVRQCIGLAVLLLLIDKALDLIRLASNFPPGFEHGLSATINPTSPARTILPT